MCAPIYDGITAEEPWRCHCRAMIGAVPGPRVLDLGIGPGVSGIEMARAAPGARIAGVDCSAAMLRRARRHVAAADLVLPLVRADAARLPFRDAAWDGVTAHSFLYLLPDGARVLREAHRVLRPDGGIALLEPSDLWGRPRLRAVTAAFRHGVRFGIAMLLWSVFSALHGRYSPVRLASELRFAGFVDVRVTRAFDGLGLLATARRP